MEAAQKAPPVGEKARAGTRTSGRRRLDDVGPRLEPGRVRSMRSSRSEASPWVSIRPMGPPSVRWRLLRNS